MGSASFLSAYFFEISFQSGRILNRALLQTVLFCDLMLPQSECLCCTTDHISVSTFMNFFGKYPPEFIMVLRHRMELFIPGIPKHVHLSVVCSPAFFFFLQYFYSVMTRPYISSQLFCLFLQCVGLF